MYINALLSRADPGFLKGGVQIRSTKSTSKKKGGGRPDGGPILGPMLKSLHRGTKGGGSIQVKHVVGR